MLKEYPGKKMKTKKLKIVFGLGAISYFIHLESVIIPIWLSGEGSAYNGGVSVDWICIVWSLFSLLCLCLLMAVIFFDFKRGSRK